MASDLKKVYTPGEIYYAASSRCTCGAGLAYPMNSKDAMDLRAWVCSRWLLGELDEALETPGGHDVCDFAFFSIKSECQPSAEGRTTRPPEQGRLLNVMDVSCTCGNKWETEPREPTARYAPGSCSVCGEPGLLPDGSSNFAKISVRTRSVLMPNAERS